MKLIIAEKKEVARAIAEAINGKATTPQGSSYDIEDGKVTWCMGHLLELIPPHEHNAQYKQWSLQHLPMDWPVAYNPIPRTAKQLKAVIALSQQATEIIHAGDPDPEGQLLVDEVLEYGGITRKPVKRLLINDNNPDAILKAMKNMPDNQQFAGLSNAAKARSICDLRYGLNLTRLYTLIAERLGYQGVLSVGRVQTPILGLIVNRDHAHESHQQTPFYTVQAAVELDGVRVTANYQPTTEDTTDDHNRLLDKAQADTIVAAVLGQTATLSSTSTKDRQKAPPLPYHLLALQADAAGLYGCSPKRVLEITQTLRDKYQAITYNRSDCRYLNEERHGEATVLMEALAPQFGLMATDANPSLKSKAFNSNKVTAHHAIIPTANVPDLNSLPAAEKAIYELIVRQYLAQFYPPEEYRTTTLTFTIAEKTFVAKGRVDVAPGWRVLFQDNQPKPDEADSSGIDGTEDEKLNLENLQQGTTGNVNDAENLEKFTQPPAYYTMQTLLQDLPRVAKYVKDPKIKKLLLDKDADKQDEAGGIGTPATRDSMIDKLFQRDFIQEKGKKLVSTELGKQFIAALPDFATTPDMTALWHEKQHQIEQGELDYQVLVDEVDAAIRAEVDRIRAEGLPLKIDVEQHTCPNCDDGVLGRRKSQHGHFWACSNRDKAICGSTFRDKSGKPDLTPKAEPELSEHNCPECTKPLIRRPTKGKGKASHWWGCSGFPACKFRAFDNNGQPEINNESPA